MSMPATCASLASSWTLLAGIVSASFAAEETQFDHPRPLRVLLGQDPSAPIVHPVLPSAERESSLGVPVLDEEGFGRLIDEGPAALG